MKTKHNFWLWAFTYGVLAVALLGFFTGSSTTVTAQEDSPDFAVLVAQNDILGNGWPAGASVTVTVDDPVTPDSPDYTATEEVGCCGAQVWFHLQDAIRVRPGHIVTMSDGVTFKDHVVTNLTITAGDIVSDTIWGTADPGSTISVILHSDQSILRNETADPQGNWLADFSIPGEEGFEQTTYDVGPWTILMVIQNDDDSDKTQIDWRSPLIMAHLIDWVHGWAWPCGATLTMTIDDPATSQWPDYEEIQEIPEYCNRDNHVLFDLMHNGFELKPGQVIVMTDGVTTREHVVRDIAFSLVNEHTDTITGRAQPGSQVWVTIYSDEEPKMHVTADGDGIWVADFSSVYDIVPGTSLNLGQADDDGDWTQDEFGSVLAIDIMPGSQHNPIIPRSRVGILVAILTTDTFDATTIDLTYSSIHFGATGTEAAPVRSALVDVDRDGDTDMVLLFNTRDTGIKCGNTFAYLAITRIWPYHLSNMGADRIMTVGCRR